MSEEVKKVRARRAHVGDFTLRISHFTARGKLMSIRKSEDKDSKRKLMTPNGQRVVQVYRDPEGEIWRKDQLGRGIENEDGSLTPVDAGAIEEAKESALTLNAFEPVAHDAEAVDEFLYPADSNGYLFIPVVRNASNKVVEDPVNDENYEYMNLLVRNPNVAFIGRCNIQGSEKMLRLSTYRGFICVQEQLYPEEVHEFETFEPTVSRADRTKLKKLAESMVKPFDPEDYPNEVTQRIAAAIEASLDGDLTKVSLDKAQPVKVDLSSVLDAALAEFG